ncbi:MAG TPA: carboxypeptidase regulatory-like domain-containing protein, partial [Bryobacteraceae bacterium]
MAQTGAIKGQVADSTGAVIPATSVTITGPGGFHTTVSTDAQGNFAANGLQPGQYTVNADHFGFAHFRSKALNVGARQTVNIPISLQLQATQQEVTVAADSVGSVSTDASANAGQLVLKGEALESLPDDPDDLASDLQALAGPAAGPNGGQIYIDGFTGGTLPPKNSIREIRINQNPFSAEYDSLGFGRIEILTKPGTNTLHGSVFFNDSDSVFNARNPFLVPTVPVGGSNSNALLPTFQSRLYGGNISGAINKKTSYFFDFMRREIDDNAIINAVTLDNNLNPSRLSQAFATPNRFTDASGRIDYQINPTNTLVARYSYQDRKASGAGIGNFTLPSQGYDTLNIENRVQLTETAVLSPRVINETRFQFLNDLTTENASSNLAAVDVLQSFNTGGAQVGRTYDKEKHYEVQNFTSFSWGQHSFKAGFRLRTATVSNYSPENFGGAFTFAGTVAPELDANNQPVLGANGQPVMTQITSIEQYRRTLLFQSLGYSFAQIQALGGGASQFSISAGNPFVALDQT